MQVGTRSGINTKIAEFAVETLSEILTRVETPELFWNKFTGNIIDFLFSITFVYSANNNINGKFKVELFYILH